MKFSKLLLYFFISFLYNHSLGTFTENTIFTKSSGALSVYAMDLDADPDMNLVSAPSNDDKVSVYVSERIFIKKSDLYKTW